MAQTRAVIDIVVAKPLPDEFLEQVGFFIGALCGTKSGYGLAAITLPQTGQSRRCTFKRLVPTRFPEVSKRICRIDIETFRRCIGAPDKGF